MLLSSFQNLFGLPQYMLMLYLIFTESVMADRKKEEAAVETVLNQLHKQHIALHEDTIKAYVDHFTKVTVQDRSLFT